MLVSSDTNLKKNGDEGMTHLSSLPLNLRCLHDTVYFLLSKSSLMEAVASGPCRIHSLGERAGVPFQIVLEGASRSAAMKTLSPKEKDMGQRCSTFRTWETP